MLQSVTDVKAGRRARYAALTRDAVLDAASKLFVDRGFDVTTIDEIARLSESSKGAVYHHFSDKKEIFAEVFRATELAVIEKAVLSAPKEGAPSDLIAAATSAFLRTYADDAAARALLRQAVSVLGWERVHAIDDEIALPAIRFALTELLHVTDDAGPPNLSVETAADSYFRPLLQRDSPHRSGRKSGAGGT